MASRPYIDIPFGPYLPDFGGMPNAQIPGYLTDALGIRSTPNGWRPAPSFADVASATAFGGGAVVYGNAACYANASVTAFFVVHGSGLMYESRAEGTDTWQNVSPSLGTIDPGGDFARFGDDIVYVSSTRAPIKKSLGSTQATLFTNLGGSPPTGNCAARIRQHLVIGGISLYDVRTSAIGDHEDWPTPGTSDALAKESITESMNPEFGTILRIVGGEKFGIIFQEYALTRMTYVGGSSVFEFDTYERKDGGGTSFGRLVYARPVTDGNLWYYYTEKGLFETDGYAVRSVSDGKFDESLFLNSISHPFGSSLEPAYSSAYDEKRGVIMFSGASYTGATTYQLSYNVADGNAALLSNTNRVVYFPGLKTGGAPYGRDVYNINGSSNKLQKLTGTSSTIAMQTGYIELDPGNRVQIQGAHLIGAGVPGSLALAYKSTSVLSAADVSQSGFTTLTAPTRGQKAVGRGNDQYFSFRITGTGTEAQLIHGIRVYFERGEPAT